MLTSYINIHFYPIPQNSQKFSGYFASPPPTTNTRYFLSQSTKSGRIRSPSTAPCDQRGQELLRHRLARGSPLSPAAVGARGARALRRGRLKGIREMMVNSDFMRCRICYDMFKWESIIIDRYISLLINDGVS